MSSSGSLLQNRSRSAKLITVKNMSEGIEMTNVNSFNEVADRMMPIGQAVMSSIFGIFLPSVDVVTDWLLVGKLLTHSITFNDVSA